MDAPLTAVLRLIMLETQQRFVSRAGVRVSSSRQESNDIGDIEHLLEALETAIEQRDSTRLGGSYSENAVALFAGAGPRVRGRSEIIQTWNRHLSRWSRIELARRDTVIRIRGEVAWGTFLWGGSGWAGEQKYRVEAERWSIVCVRESGEWKFEQTHTSLPYTDWESLRTDA